MAGPEFQGERRAPNRDTFVTISNLDIYEELVKLRTEFQQFGLLRGEVADHEQRLRIQEQHAARLWWVRPVSVGALVAVLGDIAGRIFHLL